MENDYNKHKECEKLLEDAAKNITVPNKAMVFERLKQKKEKRNYLRKIALPSLATIFVCIVLLVALIPKTPPDDTRYGGAWPTAEKTLYVDSKTFYEQLEKYNIQCGNFNNLIVSSYTLDATKTDETIIGGMITGQDKVDPYADDLEYIYAIKFRSLAYDSSLAESDVETEHKYICGNAVINYKSYPNEYEESILEFRATTIYKGVIYQIEYSSDKDDFTDFLDLIFKNA